MERERKEREKKDQEAKQKLIDTKAILEEKLKNTEALADQKFIETKSLTEEARKKIKEGDKIGAKRCLVKKKKIEQLLETLNGQIMMMDDQIIALDNAINLGMIKGTLEKANQVLKDNTVTVEEIQEQKDIMDDLKADAGQINEVIEDYNNEDEDEVSDMLDKLEDELTKEVKLPSANKENIDSSIKNKEDELNMISY